MRQFLPFENLEWDFDDFVVRDVESVEIGEGFGFEHSFKAGLLIVRHV